MNCRKGTALLPALVLAAAAHAGDGANMLSTGWLHIDNQPDADPLHTTRIATGVTTAEPSTDFSVDDGDTVALMYTRAVDDHLAVQFVGGIPPIFHLSGTGSSALVGNLGAYGTLAKVRQWSPTVLGLYTFGEARQALRPFVGLGVAYTRFTDVTLNPALTQAFVQAVKTRTAGAALDVGVDAEADDAWDPVVTAGLEYRLREHWYAIASVSYLPLSTTATVTTTVNRSASPALSTGPFTRSEASMDIDPVVGFLGVGYRF